MLRGYSPDKVQHQIKQASTREDYLQTTEKKEETRIPLVTYNPSNPRRPRDSPCGRLRCKTCPILVTTDQFSSKTTGKQYQIRCKATCKSSNLIYLISCKRCGLQYVGETEQALNERMNGHRSDIVNKKIDDKPVAAHLNSPQHTLEDLQVMVIEQLWKRDTPLRKIRESKWSTLLQTYQPLGINLRRDKLWCHRLSTHARWHTHTLTSFQYTFINFCTCTLYLYFIIYLFIYYLFLFLYK